jgi:hypothetical protein
MIPISLQDKPLASHGLTSYRYQGTYGFIMIGARDDVDALKEAQRSLTWDKATPDKLERWNGTKYQPTQGE